MWRPNTLLEAIEAGDEITLQRDRHGRYQCPNCRVLRHPAVIVDVRALPIPEDWACDACWTKWARTGRVVDDGPVLNAADNVTDRAREWKRRWVIAHGAPVGIVSKFSRE